MKKNELLTAAFAGTLALLVLYAFGRGGIFFTDDDANLGGLLAVNDGASAWNYVLSGNAGPLGRPVALASFLLQKDAYPESATPFLWVNIAIHLVNVGLLGAWVWRLQHQLPELLRRDRASWLALAVGFFWGVLPILASASLMVVQRMTTLSALFALLGAHAYLSARTHALHQRPWRLALAIAGVGLCTALSALSKENGVLLPLLLLVLHYTLFSPAVPGLPAVSPATRRGLLTLALCLWLPALAVLGYIAAQVPYLPGHYWNRPFDLPERLASQTVILWEYLRVALLPRMADLSPFRDDYPIRHFSDLAVQLAVAAWVVVLATGVRLWRRGRPLLLFAVLWYLLGHLLESSVFALFLYFEHRNYVPLIGPVLALVAWVARWTAVPANLRALLAGAYGLFLAVTLWQTTSLWGNRQQLVWAQAHPDSPRALQMLAGAYMQAGRVPEVDALYAGALQRNPQFTSVATQGLRASCYLPDQGVSTRQWLGRALRALPTGEFSHLTINSLQAVAHLQIQGRCPGLVPTDVLALTDAVQANPVFGDRASRASLHAIRANVYLAGQDTEAAMAQMRLALTAQPDIETARLLHQLTLQTRGDAAAHELRRWLAGLPPPGGNRLTHQYWQQQLAALGPA